MPYSLRVKRLAYLMDPPCWRNYSGLQPIHKRRMDARRTAALEAAQWCLTNVVEQAEVSMPPMKIAMMLHFAAVAGPFSTPEQRNSIAYAKFVGELLEDGMITRPSKEDRVRYPGWAYVATDKGTVYVEALKRVPLPVQAKPEWVMPAAGGPVTGEGPHGTDRYRPGDVVKGF